MKKRSVAVIFFSLIFFIISCESETNTLNHPIEADWVNASRKWTDINNSQLSYVDDGTDIWLDLGWYRDPPTNSDWMMGFIEEFSYSGGKLTGKYTSFQNSDSTEKFSITITFSYSEPNLTAAIVAGGALGTKTLVLTPAP